MIWEAIVKLLVHLEVITGTAWDFLIMAVVAIISSTIFIRWWFFPSNDYWEKQNVKCYNPYFWQLMRDALRQDMHFVEVERYKKYGQIYGRYDGTIPVLTIGDPEVLKANFAADTKVFINRRHFQVGDPVMDNFVSALRDEDWQRVRNVLTPTFTGNKLRQMMAKIIKCVNKVVQKLEVTIGTCEPADLEKYFSAFTMDVIATCAFGVTVYSLDSPDAPFVVNAKKLSGAGKRYATVLAQFCPFLMRLLKISIFDFEAAQFFRDFVQEVVKQRREQEKEKSPSGKGSHVDFLQMLVEAVKTDGEPSSLSSADSADDQEMKKLPLRSEARHLANDDEMISQCVMFFFAGYDTVKSTLQVTMFNLAQNQEVQEKLYQEINEIVKNKDAADYNELAQMTYLDAVLCEGLRLTSSCIRMEREVAKDYTLPELGIKLKKGQLISLPFYAIHHDPNYYPDPYKFDPERFSSEGKSQRHPMCYVPFGIGKRACVGNRFAVTEMKLCIIQILQNFKLSPAPDMKSTMTGKSKLGTFIPDKVLVNIEPRL